MKLYDGHGDVVFEGEKEVEVTRVWSGKFDFEPKIDGIHIFNPSF